MLNNNLMDEATPLTFYLSQNYPNPFKGKTIIKYCVAYKTKVVLSVYDSEGKEIEKLVDEEKNPGTYEVIFQLPEISRQLVYKDYYCRMEAGEYKNEKKMVLEN